MNETPVSDVSNEPIADLLGGQRQLLRGLSSIFWGLPVSLIICVQTMVSDHLRAGGMIPPLLATGVLLFGTHMLNSVQTTATSWRKKVNLCRIAALMIFGFSPFTYLWNRFPFEPYFRTSILLLGLSGLLLLLFLNHCIQQISYVVDREDLRAETALFTSINHHLIIASLVLCVLIGLIPVFHFFPKIFILGIEILDKVKRTLLLFLFLFPLSLTMTLLWKYKEAVMDDVFGKE